MNPPNPPSGVQYWNPPRTRQTRQEQRRLKLYRDQQTGHQRGHKGDIGDFAEFTEVYQIESDFGAKVEAEFNKMIEKATAKQGSLQ